MYTTQQPPSPTRLSLASVATAVLGDLAFMISDDEPGQPGPVWLRGEISYDGPTQGTLYCWCTRGFAAQLAANLLGNETYGDDAGPETEDALREFMNVLCGQLVVAWYGKTDVFTLSIPTAVETAELPAQTDTDDYCQMPVNGTPLHFLHRQHRPD
jgi:hypothetical protein